MSVQQRLMREIESLPDDLQERILKLVHFLKQEFFASQRKEAQADGINALLEVDKIAVETGISDLAHHHDYYLYGLSKE